MRESLLRWSLSRKKAVLNSKHYSIFSWSGQRNIRHHICYDFPQWLAAFGQQRK